MQFDWILLRWRSAHRLRPLTATMRPSFHRWPWTLAFYRGMDSTMVIEQMSDMPIQGVSDTAFWVAHSRRRNGAPRWVVPQPAGGAPRRGTRGRDCGCHADVPYDRLGHRNSHHDHRRMHPISDRERSGRNPEPRDCWNRRKETECESLESISYG